MYFHFTLSLATTSILRHRGHSYDWETEGNEAETRHGRQIKQDWEEDFLEMHSLAVWASFSHLYCYIIEIITSDTP